MGRWTQYDEDDYRLPPGMKRTGYDADTGEYFFSGGYKSTPHTEYGPLVPVGTSNNKMYKESSPRLELVSTLKLWLKTHKPRTAPVALPTEEWQLSPEDESPKDDERMLTPSIALLPSKTTDSRDKPTNGSSEDSNRPTAQFTLALPTEKRELSPEQDESRHTGQLALPIYARFSSQSDSLSIVSQTGSNVSSSSSRLTRSATTPAPGWLRKNRDRRESSVSELTLASRSLGRIAVVSESPSSRHESYFSSTNATIGSGSRIHSIITETDLPPSPPPKDCSFRSASLSFSSSDDRESWLTEDGSVSCLPYLGVSSKF